MADPKSKGKNPSDDVKKNAVRAFLGPIAVLLDDPTVTEIMINGHETIFVERQGKIERTNLKFASRDDLLAAANNIAQSVDRLPAFQADSRLDARLPDGSRVGVVAEPCARNGITIAIRKFTQTKMSMKEYIARKTITESAAEFLAFCMFLGKNMLVSGGTGSGKTTLLGLLSALTPPEQRVIVIEDSSELQINHPHIVFFETKMADAMGNGEVTIRDLLKSSLRLRPDRIIVGEVRGGEALELIQAMNTGHKGCMGTVHANSPTDAMVRLEALASSGDSRLSEKTLKYQASTAVDLVVQISRLHGGARRITAISEVRGLDDDGNYDVVPLFHMPRIYRTPDGHMDGLLEPAGNTPSFMQEIMDNNLPYPAERFRKPDAA